VSSQEITCRAVEPTDRASVVAFLENVWGTVMAARKGELFDVSSYPGYLAEIDDALVGLAACCLRGHDYEVLSIASLVPGRGVGRALMERCFDDARARGCRRVWLTTTNNNIGAIAFYQHVGMTMCDFRRDAVAMARALKPSIPLRDDAGIPIEHELDFELILG
jgi:GNAT superfamily N-acetyltransferase